MPYGVLVTQSTYRVIFPTSLVNICPSGPAKFYVRNSLLNSEKRQTVKRTVIFTTIFFNWREHFVFSCDLKLISNQFLKTYILQRSKSWLDFPRRDIFQTPSKRKCSIFDLFWPDPSIQRGLNRLAFSYETDEFGWSLNSMTKKTWRWTSSCKCPGRKLSPLSHVVVEFCFLKRILRLQVNVCFFD